MKDWFVFRRDNDRRHLLIYGGAALVFTVMCFALSVYWATAILGGGALFCLLRYRIALTDKVPHFVRFIVFILLSLWVFIQMQITISCGVLLIGFFKYVMNVIIVVGFTGLLWAATGKIKVSLIVVTVLTQIIAIADHLVVQARSFEIQFSDFSSLGTAAQVADQYSFELSEVTKIGLVLSVLFITFLVITRFPEHERSVKQLAFCGVGVLCAVLCVIIVYTQFAASVIAYQDKYWKYRGSERNGFFVNMIYSASATRVLTPDEYDSDTLKGDVEDFIAHKGEAEGKKKPNVIVIMNETFADVQNITSYMGGEMKSDVEITPFLDSLDDAAPNVIKGHALSSVYGGNTANSELEFLTGLSVQFIPRNTVAYNLYIEENNSFTIVDSFNKAGYKTVAIHPENPTNWQRDSVYDYFGFDEKYFKDDFSSVPEEEYFRGHISDSSVYDKIIEIYENKKEGESLFNFSITMQNHSGYSTLGFDYGVELEGMNGYTGIREYLTSIKNSDAAFEELIRYFEGVDEETIIVFFGDHQPSLSNIAAKFYKVSDDAPTEEQLSKYVVPYVFWANYDIDVDKDTTLTSINFLSSWLRQLVDIPETPFNQFVDALNDEVMAMNAMGWYDHDFTFHESAYATPDLNEALRTYSHLQYNMLYDEKAKLTELFSIGEGEK